MIIFLLLVSYVNNFDFNGIIASRLSPDNLSRETGNPPDSSGESHQIDFLKVAGPDANNVFMFVIVSNQKWVLSSIFSRIYTKV